MQLIRIIFRVIKDYYEAAGTDPRTKDLPLVSHHGVVISISLGYVYFVRVLGPSLMANRKPFNIKAIMQCYNIVHIILNTYIFVGGFLYYVRNPRYSWFCMGADTNDRSYETMELRKYTYVYFLSKFLDLFDTVFFVLRKKRNQISFLHIYHHALMPYASFMYHNLFFGSQFTVIGWINSLVHVLMYCYYFVAALNTKIDIEPWKQRITQIQIVQFLYIAIKLFIPLANNWCGLPYLWLSVMFMQNIFMTVLFMHFYWKTYIVKKKVGKQQQQLIKEPDVK